MKKLILVLALFSVYSIFSQGSETMPEKEFSLIVGPTVGTIKNQNIDKDTYANHHPKSTGVNFGFNYSTYFKAGLGLNIGLEFNQFKSVVDYKGVYRSSTVSKDPFNEDYYMQIETNYTDKYKLNTIDVPLSLRLQKGNERFQVFMDLGIRTHVTLGAIFEETGTYEKKGAYATNYNNIFIIVEDDWYYGFTMSKYSLKQDWQVKRLNFSANLSAGLKAKMTETLFMTFSGSYVYGLTDIVSENGRVEYVNIFKEKSAYTKTTLRQFALRAGIGYNF